MAVANGKTTISIEHLHLFLLSLILHFYSCKAGIVDMLGYGFLSKGITVVPLISAVYHYSRTWL